MVLKSNKYVVNRDISIHKLKIRNWIVPTGWGVLIFIVSSIPASPIMEMYSQLESGILRFLLSDPITHMVMFGVLGFLLGRSFLRNFSSLSKLKLVLSTFVITFFIGLAVEVYQEVFILGRALEMDDIIWNAVGIGIACVFLLISFPKMTKKPHFTSSLKVV